MIFNIFFLKLYIYIDKIFGLFQRLVTRNEFEGTGIGLSICKKIMERHGDKITVKSKIDEGTTFVIIFPMSKKNNFI